MKNLKIALKEAFPHTLPILIGYLLMGIAFGILLEKNGYNVIWAFFMGLFLYGGTTQFIAIGLMTSGAGLIETLILSLAINARQIFYAIAMLKDFENLKKCKIYMIHALTDETFALLNLKKPKVSTHEDFILSIALLNHIYWISGGIIGALAGSLLTFNIQGIDFVMSAIFINIFIDQWKNAPKHLPAIIGISSGIISLTLFGTQHFLLPALVFSVLCLILAKGKLE